METVRYKIEIDDAGDATLERVVDEAVERVVSEAVDKAAVKAQQAANRAADRARARTEDSAPSPYRVGGIAQTPQTGTSYSPPKPQKDTTYPISPPSVPPVHGSFPMNLYATPVVGPGGARPYPIVPGTPTPATSFGLSGSPLSARAALNLPTNIIPPGTGGGSGGGPGGSGGGGMSADCCRWIYQILLRVSRIQEIAEELLTGLNRGGGGGGASRPPGGGGASNDILGYIQRAAVASLTYAQNPAQGVAQLGVIIPGQVGMLVTSLAALTSAAYGAANSLRDYSAPLFSTMTQFDYFLTGFKFKLAGDVSGTLDKVMHTLMNVVAASEPLIVKLINLTGYVLDPLLNGLIRFVQTIDIAFASVRLLAAWVDSKTGGGGTKAAQELSKSGIEEIQQHGWLSGLARMTGPGLIYKGVSGLFHGTMSKADTDRALIAANEGLTDSLNALKKPADTIAQELMEKGREGHLFLFNALSGFARSNVPLGPQNGTMQRTPDWIGPTIGDTIAQMHKGNTRQQQMWGSFKPTMPTAPESPDINQQPIPPPPPLDRPMTWNELIAQRPWTRPRNDPLYQRWLTGWAKGQAAHGNAGVGGSPGAFVGRSTDRLARGGGGDTIHGGEPDWMSPEWKAAQAERFKRNPFEASGGAIPRPSAVSGQSAIDQYHEQKKNVQTSGSFPRPQEAPFHLHMPAVNITPAEDDRVMMELMEMRDRVDSMICEMRDGRWRRLAFARNVVRERGFV